VEFELPLGQLLHLLVPGHRHLQPVRVPQSARAGMMMPVNIKRPTKSTLADKGTPGQGESGASFVGEVEEDAEIVQEDTKMAGEDVVSLCQCVSLPLFRLSVSLSLATFHYCQVCGVLSTGLCGHLWCSKNRSQCA